MSAEALDRRSPVPLFLQIRQTLLGEVRHWSDPSERFHTDEALAARFGVSKMTVRKAIDDLVDAGLLSRRRGSGTFVTDRAYVEQLSPSLDVARQYFEKGENPTVQILGFTERPASIEEERLLKCPRVVSLQRVRMVRGVPLALDERTLCAETAKNAGLTKSTAGGDIAARLKEVCVLDRARWDLRALPADKEIAIHLCLSLGDPVLERAMTYFTADNEAVLFGRTLHRGDIVSCSVELPLDRSA
ncbi:MAG: GntR family transcriptional regulator [Alphaproteobacteria bacterium]